jgi:hypothetical protein
MQLNLTIVFKGNEMKYFLILLYFTSSLFSLTINDSLLEIHATLLPKVPLMDYQFNQKCRENTIIIDLIYDEVDYLSALSLKKKIASKYKDGISSYKITTKLTLYTNINREMANIYYLFPTTSKNIKKAVNVASKNKALTFSYLKNDLKYGVMISLNSGTQVKPIVNLNAIKLNDITLRPIFLDISTVYLNNEESSLDKLDIDSLNMYLSSIKISYNKSRFII